MITGVPREYELLNNRSKARTHTKAANRYISFNINLLNDILQDPAIRGATEFGEIGLLGSID